MRQFFTLLGMIIIGLGGVLAQSQVVEVVSNLTYNPIQYYKNRHLLHRANKNEIVGNRLILNDTLQLPFIDDFSKDYLRSLDPEVDIIDTINRSVFTGDITTDFRIRNTATYTYTINPLDSTANTQISLDLNDDINPLVYTNTLTGWPAYHVGVKDSAGSIIISGEVTDTLFLVADSVLTYSNLVVVRDKDTTNKWVDNYVCLNSQYAIDPLSVGVATFDGLNPFGLPHNNGSGAQYGGADTLTSMPIDLSGKLPSDSVFFSFWCERQGIGDYPNEGDSLILEFKTGNNWQMVWFADGTTAPPDSIYFKLDTMIHLNNAFYFVSDFQFRFRNWASITGNNDHWHIDYVYLDEDRGFDDTVVTDAAILLPPSNVLADYTSMPWDQFSGFEAQETNSTFILSIKNNYDVGQNFGSGYSADNCYDNAHIFDSVVANINFTPGVGFSQALPTGSFVPPNFTPANTDSVVLCLTTYIDQVPFSLTTDNDTVTSKTNFFDYLAYDDGTAEKAYGLQGPGLKQFAYEFTVNKPDTLRAIRIHFTEITDDVSDLFFSLLVWDSLDITNNGAGDSVSAEETFKRAFYIDEKNGFATYVLTNPVPVDGRFFVGWSQIDDINLQVGLDKNNVANDHMYYRAGGVWRQSLVEGAPMIRAVIGDGEGVIGTGVEQQPLYTAKKEISLYPNPTANTVHFKNTNPNSRYEVEVYDLTGKQLLQQPLTENQLKVDHLEPGMYIIRIRDEKELSARSLRFIKM